MSNQDKIKVIQEALEKATPGPWEIADTTDGYVLLDADGRELAFCESIGGADDARFIASAPEWLRFLISEIDRLKENNDKLMAWAKYALVGAKHEACKYTEDDPDTTWHCCNWSEVVEEAEKIGVT